MFDGLAFSGSQDPSTGPDDALAGYYVESALYSAAGTTYTIVGPSGQALVVVVTPSGADAASGTVGGTGQMTATTAGGSTLNLTISGQGPAASVTVPGPNGPVGFSGLNANIAPTSKLVNLSVRGSVGIGANILIEGFVTSGAGPDSIVLRGIGPTLSTFNVPGALATPQLTLFNEQGAPLASSTNWGGSATLAQAFVQVGAFALPASSDDAAMLQALLPGAYTVQLAGVGGSTGVGLTELYDDNPLLSTTRLVNISARGQVGTGGNILIAGFAITGNAPETVLIRGIGPSLAQFGLGGLLTAPQLTLFDSGGRTLDTNVGWGGSSSLSAVFTQVGAFSIPTNSVDAVLLENLPPGTYTVELSGVQGQTGVALIEVYEVR